MPLSVEWLLTDFYALLDLASNTPRGMFAMQMNILRV